MWECQVSTNIAAPPETVYSYLADFQRHKEWSSGVAELEQTTSGPIGVGTEFRAVETVPMKFTSFSRITALEPPTRIAWEAWDGRSFRVEWQFELSPHTDGTRLVQRSRFHPTGLMGKLLLALMRKRQIPAENRQSLERISTILEGRTVAG